MLVHNTSKMVHLTIKYILFFLSFSLWVISVLFIAVGVYARVEKTIEGSASRLISDPAVVVIVVGAMMFAVNFCGCLGSLRENITLLHLYAGVLVVIFLLQCVAGMAGFIFKSKVCRPVTLILLLPDSVDNETV
uniref:Uncharacterized protein n=1 Tax=Eptatretus burgeri TaxID=7764 RepID=A0A8C4QQS6_EPTBU